MTGRERVVRTLLLQNPDRVPRNLWRLPGVDMFRERDVIEVLQSYPEDIIMLKDSSFFTWGKKVSGVRYRKDETAVDEWGCEWRAAEDGVVGEVKKPLLTDISEVKKLQPPYDVLETIDEREVNRLCKDTDLFVIAWTTVRPFERMQFLLGPEELYPELLYGSKYLYRLMKSLHDFFLAELRLWCSTDVDAVSFMDDWGSQNSMLVSPELWRRLFRPLYREYCELIHAAGKHVFFHSDGFIEPIFPDLIEIGVDAVNSQLFCMNIEDLGRKYKGRITFWGEIDRQRILPFGTKQQVSDAIRRVKNALWNPEGGVIAQCEFGLQDPPDNIKTVFETWEEITRTHHALD